MTRPGNSARGRVCRVVTAATAAQLLLRGQIQSMPEVNWALVSGDIYDSPPTGIDTYHVPMRREPALADAVSFLALLRLFRAERFSLVQTHTQKASLLGLPAARLTGTPSIYTIHGSLFFRGNGRFANLFGWVFEKWCCTWATSVAVQSREDFDRLPKAKICHRSKLAYLGNGIAMARFLQPVEPALDTGRPIVLMVSRLVREKGCRDFFRMAEELKGQADFVHVGPAESDQHDRITESEIEALAADRTVTFVGPVEDVRPYLASAAIVVLPSYREGIPRAAMEAAAMGRPVAAYDIRGSREVIPPETRLLTERGDIGALTRLVRGLLDDPARAAELGRQCQKWVVERFDEDLVVERLRGIYGRLGVSV